MYICIGLEKNKAIYLPIRYFNLKENKYTFTFTNCSDGNFLCKLIWNGSKSTGMNIFKAPIQIQFHSHKEIILEEINEICFYTIPYVSQFRCEKLKSKEYIENRIQNDIKKRCENENVQKETINESVKNEVKNEMYCKITNEPKLYEDNKIFLKFKEILEKKYRIVYKLFWNIYWYELHYLSSLYPLKPSNDDKKQIIELFHQLGNNGIPCNICQEHFRIWTNMHPIQNSIDNRYKLELYLLKFHNNVNMRNKKEQFSRQDFENLYYIKRRYIEEQLKIVDINIYSLFKNNKLFIFPEYYNYYAKYMLFKYVETIPNIENILF